ncbi:YrrS family protein [Bacillus sp. B1-b2]|uniref:YrrS family protein n=1 Tax=Bacillus sp. B1-b2 TaxID=2653201 RepID=UPI0012621BAD|nr:YrrS family protein [Bacillus sp. B1-b2]KAB7667266.1 DUF1510 family protein [Bacillus sp. B1-b2]
MNKQELNEETNASRTRYQQRSKRKKTNLILNGLIIVVILLIVVVSYSIFSNKDDQEETAETTNTQQNAESAASQKDNKDSNKASDKEDEDQEIGEDGAIITEGGSDSNVITTIENPSWKPVGTTQTGEHVATYSEGTDWNEQLEAIAYATGLDSDNMVVWFLGNNNKDPQKSIGTVSSKDKTEKYRVYIEWVNGSGWKPTKVEEVQDLNIR